MRRLSRPLVFTMVSVVAMYAFVIVGQSTSVAIHVTDPGGWLWAADPVDALAELARVAGMLLATYVAIVSAAALVAELAEVLRMPRLKRAMTRLVHLFAVPALRRRLLEVAAVATVTVSSLHAATAGASSERPPVAVLESSEAPSRSAVQALQLGGEFVGFDLPSTDPWLESTSPDTYIVQPGDTLWDIVRLHYGTVDAELISTVVTANPAIRDPNLILVGWALVLPQLREPAPVADALPPVEVLIDAPPPTAGAPSTLVTVERGDTLWEIVDRNYSGATIALLSATVAANPQIEDPDLIVVGQEILLPPQPEATLSPPIGTPATLPPIEEPPVPENTSTPAVNEGPAATTVPVAAAPPPSTTIDTTTQTPPVTKPPSNSTAPQAPVPVASSAGADEETTTAVATIVGWTGAAGLAAGLLALANRRRRRQPRAVRHTRPSQSSISVGVALLETDHVQGVDRAALALRLMGSKISSHRGAPTPVPRLLRVGDEGLELVWDSPNPDLIRPWESPDGGWSWTLAGDVELEPSDAPSPCPTLVTVGRHNGADVLLNLETCGVLSIVGDDTRVTDVARSIASELATSILAESSTVLLVGALALVGRPEHAREVDATEAIGWLRDRSESASALLAHRRLTSLFALRARSKPLDAHEPVIVVIDARSVEAEQLAEITDMAHGDLGAVVILVGTERATEWCLAVEPDATRLEPLGLRLDPVMIEDGFVAIADEFVPPAEPELDESVDDVWEDDSESDGQLVLADQLDIVHIHNRALPLDDSSEVAGEHNGANDWDVELKVLGQVRAIGTREPLSPTELHLAIYLAFNRHGENADTIATMIWPNGVNARTVTNAMASLRRKLGTGADGEPLFPLGRDNQYTYHLSDRVVTDWDRFVALVDRAGRCESEEEGGDLLDAAFELIDGPPFRASAGYSWAYTDGTATLISDTVRAAASRALRLHGSRGDQLRAARTRQRALLLLDDEIGLTDNVSTVAPRRKFS